MAVTSTYLPRVGADALENVEVHLGFGLAERDQIVGEEPDGGGDVLNGHQLGVTGDLAIGRN